VAEHHRERFHPTGPNQVWSMDFVADQLADGRRFRSQTVVDIYTRECLAIKSEQRLKGEDVVLAPAASSSAIVPAFAYFAAWFVLAGLAYLVFGIETRGRSLESIEKALETSRSMEHAPATAKDNP
jgi:hypothetical protein